MKRTLLIFFTSIHFSVAAQINIVNIDLYDTSKSIIYQGIYNIIRLTGLQYDQRIKLKSSSGVIQPHDSTNNEFTFHTMETGFDTVEVIHGEKIILQKVFEIKRFADPTLTLRGRVNTSYSVQQLLAMNNPELLVILPNCLYKHRLWRVRQFRIEFYQRNELISAYEEDGPYINDRLKSDIIRLNPGYKISITARIAGPGCNRGMLYAFTITIIE